MTFFAVPPCGEKRTTVTEPFQKICLFNTVGIWIPNCLVFEWSKRGWMQNGLVFECPTIWIPDKLTPSCFLMYWAGIKMVGLVHRKSTLDWPFEYRTIWNPNFKKFRIQMFSVLRWSVFRSPLCALLLFLDYSVWNVHVFTPFKAPGLPWVTSVNQLIW